MEVASKRHAQTAYSATTRVYSPTRGSSAYAYAQVAAAPQPQQQPQQRPQPKPRPQQRPLLSLGCRWALLVTVMTLAAASLVVVSRFASIAVQYSEVNQLKSDIEDAQLRIGALNVALECAVSIQDIQDAAQRFGMTYPTASQYMRTGDTLVMEDDVAADTSAGDDTAEPEGA